MSTFKALTIAQVVAAAILISSAWLLSHVTSLGNAVIGSVVTGVVLYGLPTLYMDLQQVKACNASPQDIVSGFYKAGVGKFVLTLCAFALLFSTKTVEQVEGVFIAYLAMWFVHTTTLFVVTKTAD